MNFNFKNLSENTKRIRIIPKNDTELVANIGVDNPTAMIDEDGVFSVCLSPNETPTINCDDSPSSIILPLTGGAYYEIVDGGTIYGGLIRHLIVGAYNQNYFEGLRFEVVTGTNIDPTTVRIVNLTDNAKRIKFTVIDAATLDEYTFNSRNLNYAETVLAHNVVSVDDGNVFEFCLGIGQTPTISCDGATDSVDFAILLRDGADPFIIDTNLQIIIDGEIIPPMTPPPDWLGMGEGDPFPYDIPDGFIEEFTTRFYNLSNVNRKVEIKSLSEDIQVIAYSNPTSIQLSNDNSHAGACLSEALVDYSISCSGAPNRVNFYVTRIGQGSNTNFYLEYKTPEGVVLTEDDLISRSVGVYPSDDGFSVDILNTGADAKLIVTLVQEGVKEFVLSHDYSGDKVTVFEEGVSYGICLRSH